MPRPIKPAVRSPLSDLDALVGPQFPGHLMRRLRLPDRQFKYSYASPYLQQSLGVGVAAILAQVPAQHDWVHPGDRPRLLAALHHSADCLEPFDQEVRVLTAAGGVRWVRSMSLPKALPDGSVQWDGIALDVTERREAAAALERALELARAAEAAAWPAAQGGADLLARLVTSVRLIAAEVQTKAGRDAVRHVLDGLAQLGAPARAHPVMPHSTPGLSPRQTQVLALLGEGLSNQEIGSRLGVSAGTAKLHVAVVLRRLKVPNRAAAAVIATRGW